MKIKTSADLKQVSSDLETVVKWKHEIETRHKRALLMWHCGALTVDEWRAIEAETATCCQTMQTMAAEYVGATG